ncbi:MAG: beta-ketoacyl synthase chain length factor [Bacteroidetes bacterium]|nr:beta-ketoacyl synthase chain length factor [Bacteroidota bacterium]MBS1972888.1 beta-ketoacyl synthase chain length factor [Bacteroidota bacterium]
MFIRSASSISPQKTFGFSSLSGELAVHEGNRMHCIEPDYKEYIDPKLIRRMSRIIKMGAVAAIQCLKNGNVQNPDAIITGTAYGCLEDTGIFLSKMVEQNEDLLTPTAFIQSTHNTVAAQIALMLHCHNYNNTFVHRGFSFECALLDAIMLLNEGEATQVLVGSADETTDTSHKILSRFGLYKRETVSNKSLFIAQTKGTIAGEGACFFLLSNQHSKNDYARINGMKTFYKPGHIDEIKRQVSSFFNEHHLIAEDIDLIITGRNGDMHNDKIYDALGDPAFRPTSQINFKHLCGEYPTATSFALWLASAILKENKLPDLFPQTANKRQYRKILIYNHYLNTHHSLLLVSAC